MCKFFLATISYNAIMQICMLVESQCCHSGTIYCHFAARRRRRRNRNHENSEESENDVIEISQSSIDVPSHVSLDNSETEYVASILITTKFFFKRHSFTFTKILNFIVLMILKVWTV
jgi:hypothetical protein